LARERAPDGPNLLHELLSTSEERFRWTSVWFVRRALKSGAAPRGVKLLEDRLSEIRGQGPAREADRALIPGSPKALLVRSRCFKLPCSAGDNNSRDRKCAEWLPRCIDLKISFPCLEVFLMLNLNFSKIAGTLCSFISSIS
jgi:hypothetical protein